MLPELSVVIPSACRADLLDKCLQSLVRHVPSRTELLVIDDGSPDALITSVASQFAHVRAIRLGRPQGFCKAANVGIASARGAIIALLNDDTEVSSGWANAALPNFQNPNCGAVASLVLHWKCSALEPPRVDSAGDRYYLGGIAGKRGHGELLDARYLRPCLVFGASASSAFYRREALMQVGAFPGAFGAYFEDVDLSFRLQRAGYQIIFEPGSRVRHLGTASHPIRRRTLLEQQSLNEERVFWRNVPCLPCAVPRHFAVLAAKAWRRWHRGGLVPFLCGRLRVLGEIACIRRHRRQLDLHFPITDATFCQVEKRYWASPIQFS